MHWIMRKVIVLVKHQNQPLFHWRKGEEVTLTFKKLFERRRSLSYNDIWGVGPKEVYILLIMINLNKKLWRK